MEWLWHVDEWDRPLGAVERDRAHREGIRHRSGIVFLLDAEQRVYLTRRATTKSIFPACWDSSASFHVAHGERYEQAAEREATEELGFARTLTRIGVVRHDDPPEHQFVAVFVMEAGGQTVRLDPAEASCGLFLPIAEAERKAESEACTPWLRDGLPVLSKWMRGW